MKYFVLVTCFAVIACKGAHTEHTDVKEWKIKQAQIDVEIQKLQYKHYESVVSSLTELMDSGAMSQHDLEEAIFNMRTARLLVKQKEYKLEELKASLQ